MPPALEVPTGQFAATRSRLAPEATSPRKRSMVSFASASATVYFASRAATSLWPGLYIGDCLVCQLQVVSGFIALVFEGDRVIAVMVDRPGEGQNARE